MFNKTTIAIIVIALVSILALGIVSASPRGQAATEQPFELLIDALLDGAR